MPPFEQGPQQRPSPTIDLFVTPSEEMFDGNNHLNFGAFPALMASTHNEIFRKLTRLTLDEWSSRLGCSFMVRALHVEYHRQVFAAAPLRVSTALSLGAHSSMKFSHGIFDRENQLVGEVKFTIVATRDGQSFTLSEEFRRAAGRV